jgi:hypothetical protein
LRTVRAMRATFQFAASLLLGAALFSAAAIAAETEPKKVDYHGLEAWRLSDGKTEAIVVPAWGGRLMHYGKVGGENWLWAGDPKADSEYFRWGGDKTFPGPHPMWAFTLGKMWPPPKPDTTPHTAEVRDGWLVTTSPAWEAYGGARVSREYSFAENGDFVVRHRITPVAGSGVPVCAWVISQCATSTAYLPMTPASPYKDGFFWLGGARPEKAFRILSPTLLEIAPEPGKAFKLGTPSNAAAIAARRGREVFVQRAEFVKDAQYPDGAPGAGLTAEYYHHNAKGAGEYIELELVSPLRPLREGVDFTTRWSIHTLAGDSPAGLEELLQ